MKKLRFKGIEKNCCAKFKLCPRKRQTQRMEHNISHRQYNKIRCTASVTIKEIDLNVAGATKWAENNKQLAECSIKKDVLKNFAKFTRKHYRLFFSIKKTWLSISVKIVNS